jgi:glycerol kinase
MSAQGILSIDQGSGSTKSIVLNSSGKIIARANVDLETIYSQSGWVQQNPEKIWESVLTTAIQAVNQCQEIEIVGIGLSTQRESLVIWSRATGNCLSPVLTWQDRSSAPLLANFDHFAEQIRLLSGLPLDPMFTALKAVRILSELQHDLSDICIGTVDSWLLWKLGAGHVIELGNASRTQLVDVKTGMWSPELLEIFRIDERVLPRIVDSNFKHSITNGVIPGIAEDVQVCGVLGDSHAALFAHAGWIPGRVKATYGTGTSVMTIGNPEISSSGLCKTIGWSLDGVLSQALEANILSSGSTLVWLANLFDETVENLMQLTESSTEVVHLVPAFNGLAAPWWDDRAQGTISGVTLGTSKADLISAGLDSIAMQVSDILDEIRAAGIEIKSLHVDGGGIRNIDLLQRQSDFGNVAIDVPTTQELSAVGAGNLAGLSMKLWNFEELESRAVTQSSFSPLMDHSERKKRREGWKNAVMKARIHS